MLNYILTYVTLSVFFILQSTIGIYIDICGIAPNLIFVFAVCYAMYNYPVRSGVLCLIAGIVVDLYSRKYIGINALLYMYTGLAVSKLAATLIRKNVWTAALGVLIASAIYHTAILIIDFVVPGYSGFLYPFMRFVLPSTVYDAVVSIVIALWARWLSTDRIRGI